MSTHALLLPKNHFLCLMMCCPQQQAPNQYSLALVQGFFHLIVNCDFHPSGFDILCFLEGCNKRNKFLSWFLTWKWVSVTEVHFLVWIPSSAMWRWKEPPDNNPSFSPHTSDPDLDSVPKEASWVFVRGDLKNKASLINSSEMQRKLVHPTRSV